jgi:glycosyltransferase involved in cell wall biosynthesis
MIYVNLPSGDGWGSGVVGDNLAVALEALAPIKRIGPWLPDPLMSQEPIAGSLLQLCLGATFLRGHSGVGADRHVGYVIFEEDLVARRSALEGRDDFDVFVTACRWGEETLREVGLKALATVHHGVDLTRFNPARACRRRDDDRFVIFSGGKFEFRKGQDIVVRAFKIFADRHPDALLVTNWYNPFPDSAATMAASPYWPFACAADDRFIDALRRWLTATGVDLSRVRLLPPRPNANLAAIYGDSDIGLFPNRCEGATNLVLMEYLACGRTVVATDFSGHRDVLSEANSLRLRAWRPQPVFRDGMSVAVWCEPDVEEIVERLEHAYRNRDRLEDLARQAAADMMAFTWNRAARRFLHLLSSNLPVANTQEQEQ